MAQAHLCGSLNLPDSDTVFRTVAAIAADSVRRIPDGETDDRQDWIQAQVPRLASNPALERVADEDHEYRVVRSFRLRDGVDPEDVEFSLGYAERASAAYAQFTALRAEGVIPVGTRFQVSLPTQMAIVNVFIVAEHRAALAPVYEAALAREIAAILEVVPARDLALQWDVAVEISRLEGVGGAAASDATEAQILDQLARLGDLVPASVEVGYHLCYGDSPPEKGARGRHFKQPEDTALLVRLANGIVQRATRPIDWVHMPVPVDRSDDAYYAPLDDLRLPDDTELYLGLVHAQDGVPGAQRRIAAAARHVRGFGVATECGMGRRPREEVAESLRIQREVVVPAT